MQSKPRLLCLLPLLLVFQILKTQNPCGISTATATLDVNNVKAILQASGDFWWDRSDAGYFVPQVAPGEPQPAAVFAAGLWLGGLDEGSNLKMACQTYGAASNHTDWWPGPLDLTIGTASQENCMRFNRLWKINKPDIDAHIADFNDNGVIDGPVPMPLLAWPGRNNPESFFGNGFDLPIDQPLAPFFDRNGNGNYEPKLGDYPLAPGDQALWWVFNDEGAGAIHGETNATAIRAEVQAFAYAYAGENDENLFNTTFYDFKIINRALEDIDSAFVSLWMDADIGCYLDDYFGSVPEEKMAFFYNEDANDGTPGCTCPGGVVPYCEESPILGVKVLRGPKGDDGEDKGFSSFTYHNNTSWGTPPPKPGTTDPSFDFEYYNYMTGRWKDGTEITYGGEGYNPSSNDIEKFAFPGNPSNADEWSMCHSQSPNFPSGLPEYDRRTLINSGPFRLAPGESTSICYAVMSYFGAELPCPDVTPLIEMGNAVEAFCESLSSAGEVMADNPAIHFYPNPMSTEGKLVLDDQRHFMQQVALYSMDGRLLNSFSNLHTRELSIQRGDQPAGMYFYKILSSDGRLSTGRLVMK